MGAPFLLYQVIHPVKRHPPVILDNPAAPVCVRQSGDNAGFPRRPHLPSINAKNPVVMGLPVFEHRLDCGVYLPVVCL